MRLDSLSLVVLSMHAECSLVSTQQLMSHSDSFSDSDVALQVPVMVVFNARQYTDVLLTVYIS